MSTPLGNPGGEYREITDYSSGTDIDGELVSPEVTGRPYRAASAVTRGQALMFVTPTSTVALSVAPMTAEAAKALFAGVALHGAAAGNTVLVGHGHCLVDVGEGTAVAEYNIIPPGTTTGVFDVVNYAEPGSVGTLWGEKNTDNLAFAYVQRAALPGENVPGAVAGVAPIMWVDFNHEYIDWQDLETVELGRNVWDYDNTGSEYAMSPFDIGTITPSVGPAEIVVVCCFRELATGGGSYLIVSDCAGETSTIAAMYDAVLDDGTRYLAVLDGYSAGGKMRLTTVEADLDPHVFNLVVNGADTALYVDGVLAPWAGAATDELGDPADWDATNAEGIGLLANGDPNGDTVTLLYDAGWPAFAAAPINGASLGLAEDLWYSHCGIVPLLSAAQRMAFVASILANLDLS